MSVLGVRRSVGCLVAFVFFVGFGAGCDRLLDDTQDLPDFGRLLVTGTSPVDLEIITSTNFNVVSDPGTGESFAELILSDTTLTLPPHDRTFDIRTAGRLFIRVTNHELEVADVTVVVSFDGTIEYSQSATMSAGGNLEFSQIFRGT